MADEYLPNFGRPFFDEREREELVDQIRDLPEFDPDIDEDEDVPHFNDLEVEFHRSRGKVSRSMYTGGLITRSQDLSKVLDLDAAPELFKQAGVTYTDGDEERIVEAVASAGSLDQMKDIVNPGGWDLSVYKSNPVLLFNHKDDEPIGAVVRIRQEDNPHYDESKSFDHERTRLMAIPYFARTAAGDEKLVLYKTGSLRAFSVRFRPTELRKLSEAEKEDFGLTSPLSIFSQRQRLIELSSVTLPAHPEALVTAKSSDGLSEAVLERFIDYMDDIFEKMEVVVEGLNSVSDRFRVLDEIRDELREFVVTQESSRTSKSQVRADELYGGAGANLTYEELKRISQNLSIDI
jgi:hypothetical protein